MVLLFGMKKPLKHWSAAGLHGRFGLYYIGGSDILPPPLKGEEEKRALAALEQGDEKAKQLLV